MVTSSPSWGEELAAVLRAGAHATAQLLRAVGHVIAEAFRLAGRGMVRLLVALRPVAFASGRTVGRLGARVFVVFLVGVLTVRLAFHVAGVTLRVMIVATGRAAVAVSRAIATVLGPPLRLAARGLAAAFRIAAQGLAAAFRVGAAAAGRVASALASIASALASVVGRAARLIASGLRFVVDRLIAPAVRAARLMILAFVGIAIVLPVRAARRLLAAALASIRAPVAAAARALIDVDLGRNAVAAPLAVRREAETPRRAGRLRRRDPGRDPRRSRRRATAARPRPEPDGARAPANPAMMSVDGRQLGGLGRC